MWNPPYPPKTFSVIDPELVEKSNVRIKTQMELWVSMMDEQMKSWDSMTQSQIIETRDLLMHKLHLGGFVYPWPGVNYFVNKKDAYHNNIMVGPRRPYSEKCCDKIWEACANQRPLAPLGLRRPKGKLPPAPPKNLGPPKNQWPDFDPEFEQFLIDHAKEATERHKIEQARIRKAENIETAIGFGFFALFVLAMIVAIIYLK